MALSRSASRSALPRGPAESRYPKPLLDSLQAEYHELSPRVVAGALERAYSIEQSLAAGAEVAPGRVALLARHRLDVLRGRANSARGRVGRRHSLPVYGPPGNGAGPDELPCTYCRRPVPAASFGYLSGMRQLALATCPTCERRTTVRISTWVRTGEPTQSD